LQQPAGGLPFWSAQPDFAQIVHGGNLQAHPEVNFESDLAPAWSHETTRHLDLSQPDGSCATVILGVSIGALVPITADLSHPGSNWVSMIDEVGTVATQSAQIWMTVTRQGLGYPPGPPPAMIAAPEPQDVWADMSVVIATEGWTPGLAPKSVQYVCGPLKEEAFASLPAGRARVEQNTATWLVVMTLGAWPSAANGSSFAWSDIVATSSASGQARLTQQHLQANFEGSERYVLSVAGSTAFRLPPNQAPAANLYLAGDWTLNGLNAGCVEAAVMSGIEAARAVRGDPPFAIPGATD
jgi:uncharacterized protein with NAD-binding domain and iron-sulfur cluster